MDRKFFDIAFLEAKKAFDLNEVPIAAVIIKDGKVVSKAYNQKEIKHCCLYHAEIIAIKEASNVLNNWRLDDCEMYVTLDPCPMCASAIKQSRIKKVYSALSNSDNHNSDIIHNIFKKDMVNPSVIFESDLDIERSRKLLNSFFEKQRNC